MDGCFIMTRFLAVHIFIIIVANTALAKVAEPPSLIAEGVKFTSYLNTVEAVRISDNAVIWKVRLPVDINATVKDPNLERDVQQNIIVGLTINHPDSLLVRFKSGRMFLIEIKTGRYRETAHLPITVNDKVVTRTKEPQD